MITENIVGRHYSELPSPCLLVDLDALEYNIKTMQAMADSKHCALRPHIKTHKSPRIAHLQVEAGAVGVTCAKLGEAIVMSHAGIKSILIANQIVGDGKIKVLAGLNRYGEVMPCVDNLDNAKDISRIAKEFHVTIPVFLEIEIGLDRCGVRTAEEAIALAAGIAQLDNIYIKGIQAYEGRGNGSTTSEAKIAYAGETVGKAVAIKQALAEAGYEFEILSGSSTGTCSAVSEMDGVTELQPGTYAFMESAYTADEIMIPFKQALFVHTKVVSVYGGRRIVTDAGEKCIGVDQGLPYLVDDPEAILALHEEHCKIDTTEKLSHLKVGDSVLLVPGHCCTTANLHDFYYCVRNGIVEDVWPIEARGKLQ